MALASVSRHPPLYTLAMKRILPVLVALLFASAQAQTITPATFILDGRDLGQTTVYLSGGQLMLPLTAFAQLGWKPLLDTDNHLIDLAGCLRVSTMKPNMWLMGGPASVGVRSASALAPLPVGAQFRGGRWYLPARAVAGQLLYNVTFDKASARVEVKKPSDPAKINPTVEACLLGLGR